MRIYKVLVIDDAVFLRNIMKLAIKKMPPNNKYKIQSLEAENGLDGLELCKYGQPDIITLDLNMPKMGGYEFIEKILEINKYIKIIVISSSKREVAEEKVLNMGAFAYIEKPCKEQVLWGHIDNAIKEMEKEDKEDISSIGLKNRALNIPALNIDNLEENLKEEKVSKSNKQSEPKLMIEGNEQPPQKKKKKKKKKKQSTNNIDDILSIISSSDSGDDLDEVLISMPSVDTTKKEKKNPNKKDGKKTIAENNSLDLDDISDLFTDSFTEALEVKSLKKKGNDSSELKMPEIEDAFVSSDMKKETSENKNKDAELDISNSTEDNIEVEKNKLENTEELIKEPIKESPVKEEVEKPSDSEVEQTILDTVIDENKDNLTEEIDSECKNLFSGLFSGLNKNDIVIDLTNTDDLDDNIENIESVDNEPSKDGGLEVEIDKLEIKDNEFEIEDNEFEIEDNEFEIEDDEFEIEDDEFEIEDDELEIKDNELEINSTNTSSLMDSLVNDNLFNSDYYKNLYSFDNSSIEILKYLKCNLIFKLNKNISLNISKNELEEDIETDADISVSNKGTSVEKKPVEKTIDSTIKIDLNAPFSSLEKNLNILHQKHDNLDNFNVLCKKEENVSNTPVIEPTNYSEKKNRRTTKNVSVSDAKSSKNKGEKSKTSLWAKIKSLFGF